MSVTDGPSIGQFVQYIEKNGMHAHGLVVAEWSNPACYGPRPGLNIAYVARDWLAESRASWGKPVAGKLEIDCSVVHVDANPARRRAWSEFEEKCSGVTVGMPVWYLPSARTYERVPAIVLRVVAVQQPFDLVRRVDLVVVPPDAPTNEYGRKPRLILDVPRADASGHCPCFDPMRGED